MSASENTNRPRGSPELGDKDPAVIAWWFENHPEEARRRYENSHFPGREKYGLKPLDAKTPESQGATSVDLPPTKLPSEYTGRGIEIIGNPQYGGGEIWYEDGICRGLTSGSFLREKNKNVPLAKQIAQFHLDRLERDKDLPPGDVRALQDKRTAERLAHYFTQEILEGRVEKLAPAIIKAIKTERSRAEKKRELNSKIMDEDRQRLTGKLKAAELERVLEGRKRWLAEVELDEMRQELLVPAMIEAARRCEHPERLTVSDIRACLMEHRTMDPDPYSNREINQSMLTSTVIRRWLQAIGFGWIPPGRVGNPPGKRRG